MSAEIFLNGRVTMHIGDVREKLREMPADHFDCVVTSPPYWGLRDYGVAGQIGLEPTLGEHLAVMVDVFDEVRRVMKPTATLWLNYGDCYATSPNGRSAADTKAVGNDDRTFRDKPFSTIGAIYDPEGGQVPDSKNPKARAGASGNRGNTAIDHGGRIRANGGYLKAKDLCMIPNRLAIALQEAGWWVRSEIIWHKPNPMPESITDRPTTSHEKIWLLSKRERYFYDSDAIREPSGYDPSKTKFPDGWDTGPGAHGSIHRNGREKGRASGNKSHKAVTDYEISGSEQHRTKLGLLKIADVAYSTRNSRNVWTIGTAAFSEAHFATFPPELAERCIKAGCPDGGTVLDPFGGAGTTALVAATLGRTASLIELNPEYAIIARARIEAAFMGREEGARHMVKQLGKTADPGPLFEVEAAE